MSTEDDGSEPGGEFPAQGTVKTGVFTETGEMYV